MPHLSDEKPKAIGLLSGCPVMLINTNSDIEGSGSMQHCYHTILDKKDQWLHLNRYLSEDHVPPEVTAVTRLMQTINPGLTCDLHEGNGSGFWMPITKPDIPDPVIQMTGAFFDHIKSGGYPITDYDDWKATDQTNAEESNLLLPEPSLTGLFWLNILLKNEGHNLITYSHLFGTAYGTEAPMERPLNMRTNEITNGILAAIKVWEKTQ